MKRKRFDPVPVAPIGTAPHTALINGRCDTIEFSVYPPTPRGAALRALRVSLSVGLRRAARALGMSELELSGLERGCDTIAETEWDRAEAILREHADARKTGA